MVMAQALLVLPVVTALTRQAVEDAERVHGEQLQSIGARPRNLTHRAHMPEKRSPWLLQSHAETSLRRCRSGG